MASTEERRISCSASNLTTVGRLTDVYKRQVLIISLLAAFGIAMAPLPIAVIASVFAAAATFGAILDLVKIPVFRRLRIS